MTDFLAGIFCGVVPAFWQIGQLRAASRQIVAQQQEIDRLNQRDALRRLELADTDATLAESEERGRDAERAQREMVLKVSERLRLASEVLGNLAERRSAVVLTETDYPLE